MYTAPRALKLPRPSRLVSSIATNDLIPISSAILSRLSKFTSSLIGHLLKKRKGFSISLLTALFDNGSLPLFKPLETKELSTIFKFRSNQFLYLK